MFTLESVFVRGSFGRKWEKWDRVVSTTKERKTGVSWVGKKNSK